MLDFPMCSCPPISVRPALREPLHGRLDPFLEAPDLVWIGIVLGRSDTRCIEPFLAEIKVKLVFVETAESEDGPQGVGGGLLATALRGAGGGEASAGLVCRLSGVAPRRT